MEKTLSELNSQLKLLWFLLILFSSGMAFGQDGFMEIHLSPFSTRSLNAVKTVDSLSLQLATTENSYSPEVGITFRLGRIDKILYTVDIDLQSVNVRFEQNQWLNLPEPQLWTMKTKYGSNTVQVGFGIDRPLRLHPKLLALIGGRLFYAITFDDRLKRTTIMKDSDNVLIGSIERSRKSANEHQIGARALLGVYYDLAKRFSIGVNLINSFGNTFVKGDFISTSLTRDSNGDETAFSEQRTVFSETRFAYNFSVSFGIQYQIAKRKEKKKY